MTEKMEIKIKKQLQQQGIDYLQDIGNLIYHDQQKVAELIKEHELAGDLVFYGLQAVYESYDAGTELQVIKSDMQAMYGSEQVEDFFKEQNVKFKFRKEADHVCK